MHPDQETILHPDPESIKTMHQYIRELSTERNALSDFIFHNSQFNRHGLMLKALLIDLQYTRNITRFDSKPDLVSFVYSMKWYTELILIPTVNLLQLR